MELTAYCFATEQKNVPFHGKPLLEQTKNGGFILRGFDELNNKMCAIISKANADKAIRLGLVVDTINIKGKVKKHELRIEYDDSINNVINDIHNILCDYGITIDCNNEKHDGFEIYTITIDEERKLN